MYTTNNNTYLLYFLFSDKNIFADAKSYAKGTHIYH